MKLYRKLWLRAIKIQHPFFVTWRLQISRILRFCKRFLSLTFKWNFPDKLTLTMKILTTEFIRSTQLSCILSAQKQTHFDLLCLWEQRWVLRSQRTARPGWQSHSCKLPSFCVLEQSENTKLSLVVTSMMAYF